MCRRRGLFITKLFAISAGTPYDSSTLSYDATGGTKTITVQANRDWEFISIPECMTLSVEYGGKGKTEVTLTASENLEDHKVTGHFVLRSKNHRKSIMIPYEIGKAGIDHETRLYVYRGDPLTAATTSWSGTVELIAYDVELINGVERTMTQITDDSLVSWSFWPNPPAGEMQGFDFQAFNPSTAQTSVTVKTTYSVTNKQSNTVTITINGANSVTKNLYFYDFNNQQISQFTLPYHGVSALTIKQITVVNNDYYYYEDVTTSATLSFTNGAFDYMSTAITNDKLVITNGNEGTQNEPVVITASRGGVNGTCNITLGYDEPAPQPEYTITFDCDPMANTVVYTLDQGMPITLNLVTQQTISGTYPDGTVVGYRATYSGYHDVIGTATVNGSNLVIIIRFTQPITYTVTFVPNQTASEIEYTINGVTSAITNVSTTGQTISEEYVDGTVVTWSADPTQDTRYESTGGTATINGENLIIYVNFEERFIPEYTITDAVANYYYQSNPSTIAWRQGAMMPDGSVIFEPMNADSTLVLSCVTVYYETNISTDTNISYSESSISGVSDWFDVFPEPANNRFNLRLNSNMVWKPDYDKPNIARIDATYQGSSLIPGGLKVWAVNQKGPLTGANDRMCAGMITGNSMSMQKGNAFSGLTTSAAERYFDVYVKCNQPVRLEQRVGTGVTLYDSDFNLLSAETVDGNWVEKEIIHPTFIGLVNTNQSNDDGVVTYGVTDPDFPVTGMDSSRLYHLKIKIPRNTSFASRTFEFSLFTPGYADQFHFDEEHVDFKVTQDPNVFRDTDFYIESFYLITGNTGYGETAITIPSSAATYKSTNSSGLTTALDVRCRHYDDAGTQNNTGYPYTAYTALSGSGVAVDENKIKITIPDWMSKANGTGGTEYDYTPQPGAPYKLNVEANQDYGTGTSRTSAVTIELQSGIGTIKSDGVSARTVMVTQEYSQIPRPKAAYFYTLNGSSVGNNVTALTINMSRNGSMSFQISGLTGTSLVFSDFVYTGSAQYKSCALVVGGNTIGQTIEGSTYTFASNNIVNCQITDKNYQTSYSTTISVVPPSGESAYESSSLILTVNVS